MELLAVNETKGFDRLELRPALARRMEFLDEQARKLLEMTFIGRISRREAAMLMGMSRGGVTRRITRLMNLLHDPLVIGLIEAGEILPEDYREMGLAYFLRGWTVGRIAREFKLSPYFVKRVLTYVRAWHDANK